MVIETLSLRNCGLNTLQIGKTFFSASHARKNTVTMHELKSFVSTVLLGINCIIRKSHLRDIWPDY